MSLLEKACDAGNANGCYYASGFYISGLKTDPVSKDKNKESDYTVLKNMEQAYRYALRGCELGNVYCCINLSQMYSKGEGKLLLKHEVRLVIDRIFRDREE